MFLARLVLAFAMLAGAALPAFAQTTTVRVLVTPIDSASEIWYAKDMGFFAKQGLDVDVQPGANGSQIATAVSANAVDIGYSDLVTLAKGYLKGIPFVAIAPAAIWTSAAPVAGLVVMSAASIQPAIDVTAKYGKFEAFPASALIYKP